MTLKILWASKHKPLPSQIMWIANNVTKDYEMYFCTSVLSAEWLIHHYIKPLKINIIIPVLPLSIIKTLHEKLNGKVQLWWPEMELVKTTINNNTKINPNSEVAVKSYDEYGREIYKIYRFKRFLCIKEINIVYEEIKNVKI